MKDLNITILFDYYCDLLNDKQRELFDLYYNADLSLSEIANDSGITRQGVRDSVKRTEQLLIEYENKLKFCEKAERLKKISHNIQSTDPTVQKLIELIHDL